MMSFWQAPVVVVALLTWLNSTPTSFAEAAQREALRRQLMPKSTRQLSNLNLPASAIITESSLAAAAAAAAPATTADDGSTPAPAQAKTADAQAQAASGGTGDGHDEQWWRNRIASARQDLDAHQRLAAALQSQINALTTDAVNRDDPAQQQKLFQDRQKAMSDLAGMQKQIDADNKAIAAVQDDARRAGVPAGWVR